VGGPCRGEYGLEEPGDGDDGDEAGQSSSSSVSGCGGMGRRPGTEPRVEEGKN
jgi:hypothetical protein